MTKTPCFEPSKESDQTEPDLIQLKGCGCWQWVSSSKPDSKRLSHKFSLLKPEQPNSSGNQSKIWWDLTRSSPFSTSSHQDLTKILLFFSINSLNLHCFRNSQFCLNLTTTQWLYDPSNLISLLFNGNSSSSLPNLIKSSTRWAQTKPKSTNWHAYPSTWISSTLCHVLCELVSPQKGDGTRTGFARPIPSYPTPPCPECVCVYNLLMLIIFFSYKYPNCNLLPFAEFSTPLVVSWLAFFFYVSSLS